MKFNVEIISVNFNTPDLIERLLISIKEKEGDYPVRIIDGSDREPFKTQIKEVCEKHGATLFTQGWNIHHGRGMDLGVSTSNYEYVLIMDSDNYVKQPMIDKMVNALVRENKMICGYHCYVNQHGISTGRTKSPEQPILYYHPMCFLIKTNYYNYLRQCNAGFIHHGAPCINMMIHLYNNDLSEKVGITMPDALGFKGNTEEYNKWVCLESRGTVNRFGYLL